MLVIVMKRFYNVMAGCALATGLLASGCGGKEEPMVVAPPPAAAPVSLTAAPDPAAPPVAAPGEAPPPAAATGATTPNPADEFKGMTEKQIDEFKKGYTPETHDLNIGLVAEGALAFFNEYGRAPQNVEQIANSGFIRKGITAPKGKQYVIDPKTLNVTTVDK